MLTALEARILGVLIEKQLTVPDTYPLSLNALKAGCNQKNNRDPVLSVGEAELAAAQPQPGRERARQVAETVEELFSEEREELRTRQILKFHLQK